MRTKSILLMLLCTLFTSIAQVFYKKGASEISGIYSVLTNYFIYIGIFLYVIGLVFMLVAFKDGEVSVLYPIIALSYVWVIILSKYIFNEAIGFYKSLAIIFIMIGIIFVGRGK